MADVVPDTIDVLARPLAEEAGLDLVEVQLKGGSSRLRIRVIVDRKGGVDVGTCQALSRQLARRLDEMDLVEGRYTLEVTSPGTDYPLADQRAFDRVEGRTVKAVLPDGEATREVVGTVELADAEAVRLRAADGDIHTIPYGDILKATQVLPW